MSYSVTVYDRAGQFHNEELADFPAAARRAAVLRAGFRDKVVRVANLDRCDERFDGLTEDEREELEAG